MELEAFLAFDAEDASVRDRSRWKAALDGPLPQEGVGLDKVVEELLEALGQALQRFWEPTELSRVVTLGDHSHSLPPTRWAT